MVCNFVDLYDKSINNERLDIACGEDFGEATLKKKAKITGV